MKNLKINNLPLNMVARFYIKKIIRIVILTVRINLYDAQLSVLKLRYKLLKSKKHNKIVSQSLFRY